MEDNSTITIVSFWSQLNLKGGNLKEGREEKRASGFICKMVSTCTCLICMCINENTLRELAQTHDIVIQIYTRNRPQL